MFTIPNFFPFISMIDGNEDSGGGNEQEPIEDEFGVPYAEPGEEHQEPDSEITPSPAWQAVLDLIDEDKRTAALPKLKEWDDNFAKVQSDFAPYKPLLEHKVTMDEVNKAFAFANLVNTNPRALYDELGQRFGFGQGQKQVEKDDEDDPDLEKQEPFDLSKHPQFVQMQQTIQQFQQKAMEDQQRQQEAQYQQSVLNDFATIENEFKVKLSPRAREEVLIRSVKIGDRTGNYDIREGYKDYSSFVNSIRNSRANNTAPRVFSGNGNLPANDKPVSQMNDQERADRIVAFLEAQNKANNEP